MTACLSSLLHSLTNVAYKLLQFAWKQFGVQNLDVTCPRHACDHIQWLALSTFAYMISLIFSLIPNRIMHCSFYFHWLKSRIVEKWGLG